MGEGERCEGLPGLLRIVVLRKKFKFKNLLYVSFWRYAEFRTWKKSRNSVKSRGISRNYPTRNSSEFRRNFCQFRTEYGIDGSKKTDGIPCRQNSVDTLTQTRLYAQHETVVMYWQKLPANLAQISATGGKRIHHTQCTHTQHTHLAGILWVLWQNLRPVAPNQEKPHTNPLHSLIYLYLHIIGLFWGVRYLIHHSEHKY
jgi:hypothetical protein